MALQEISHVFKGTNEPTTFIVFFIYWNILFFLNTFILSLGVIQRTVWRSVNIQRSSLHNVANTGMKISQYSEIQLT